MYDFVLFQVLLSYPHPLCNRPALLVRYLGETRLRFCTSLTLGERKFWFRACAVNMGVGEQTIGRGGCRTLHFHLPHAHHQGDPSVAGTPTIASRQLALDMPNHTQYLWSRRSTLTNLPPSTSRPRHRAHTSSG